MTRTDLIAKLARDHKCPACKGTGKRGRGKCSACQGKGVADLNHPRIRFNWGFHDAAMETSLKDGARIVVEVGEQTTRQVSVEANFWYARGYQAGLDAVAAGTYQNSSSQPAWIELVGAETDAQYNRR